jgi:hypothetical protein
VTADAKGKLMDVATISRELGVSRSVAEKIARQLPKVKLPDIAKVYVKRADVDRYLETHTVDVVSATARRERSAA